MQGGRPPGACLYVLGGFRLVTEAGEDVAPKAAKARAMLACAALSPGGSADRGKLAGLLWGEAADAKGSLRQCVKELRRALQAADLPILLADTHRIILDLRHLWVDALEAERLARSPVPADLDALAELCAGELLEGLELRDPEFEEWLQAERARLCRTLCRGLESGLARSLDERDLERVERIAGALLALEPAHEGAHQALMRRHALGGDLAAAVKQYHTCKDALARGLDLKPSVETEALLRELRAGAPAANCSLERSPKPAHQPLVGPVMVIRGPPHASITVEERTSPGRDATDEAVCATLVDALREALSRKRWFSVVDPVAPWLVGPSGTPQGPHAPEGPQYRVVVTFRRVLDRVRFSAELQEATACRILWADHYDRNLGSNLLDLVDDLSRALARRLDREVEVAEIMRASRQPVEALSAYDCVLRAIPLIFKLTPASFAEAERMLLTAQDADPHDPLAYAWRAFWYSIDIGQGWVPDLDAAKAELDFLVRRAIELDPKNAFALTVAGHIASYVRHDYERALSYFKQSLLLDPNSAYAWDFSAVTLSYTGRADEALEQLDQSRELWQQHPDPYYFRTTAIIALLLAGRPEKAAVLGRQAVRENPNFQAAYRPLIASLGLIGETEQARAYIGDLIRLSPDFSIDWFRANYPPLRGKHGELYLEGLRKAGVPS